MAARPSPALRAVVGLPMIGLGVLVAAWWLLIAAAVAPLLPSPGARLLPGHRAHIARGMRDWPIPTSRLAFDAFQRGYAAADDAAQAEAFARAGWVTVNDGDAVQIVAIDGEVVEITLLEGGYVGRRAWLKQRQLTPWD